MICLQRFGLCAALVYYVFYIIKILMWPSEKTKHRKTMILNTAAAKAVGPNVKWIFEILLVVLFILILPIFIYNYHHLHGDNDDAIRDIEYGNWILKLVFNLCGYGTILVPGYVLVKYFKHSSYVHNSDGGCLVAVIRSCVIGSGVRSPSLLSPSSPSLLSVKNKPQLSRFSTLLFCSTGLLVSYLVWGLLQERIMSIKYTDQSLTTLSQTVQSDSRNDSIVPPTGEHFRNSLFLEFMNRILAVLISVVLLFVMKQPHHSAPVYMYSFNAFSNVMSSWFQYEALKYVTFPIQVLSKAAKVIPVMLMGKVVSRRTYTKLEYITAAMLSIGLFLFLFSNSSNAHKHKDKVTHVQYVGHYATVSGILLMIGYLVFDAFTSNWQGELFRSHHMSSIQMMAGANLFSVLFTSISLIEQGGFGEALSFILKHPTFMGHITILAVTSTIGQLFIYYTIDQFGPVTFTVIMTVRLAFAILLSCIVYQHAIHYMGMVGIVICFAALFLRIYLDPKNGNKSSATQSARTAGVDKV